MGETITAIIFLITFFGTIFGVTYFYYTTRHRERMALIEKNADPALFKSKPKGTFRTFVIKLGMLFAGAGLGTLVGNILDQTTGLTSASSYVSMIFLFSGAGLVASYYISKKALKNS